MQARFDKFTVRARRSLTHAQAEAQRFNHNYIGTEHLLLGLLHESDSVAAKVLNNLGVELGAVRSKVELIIGRGDRPISGEISLTPRAKKVIELAVAEARQLNHTHIGTEDMLSGLLGEGEGVAWGVLDSLGVSVERVREATAALLEERLPHRSRTFVATLPIPAVAGGPAVLDNRARDGALLAVRTAIQAVSSFSGGEMERDLMDALLLPRLTSLTQGLFTHATSAADLAWAQRSIIEAMGALGTASGVLRKHGHEAVAQTIDDAVTAVARAITPESQV